MAGLAQAAMTRIAANIAKLPGSCVDKSASFPMSKAASGIACQRLCFVPDQPAIRD
jgi:hypothetical protein